MDLNKNETWRKILNCEEDPRMSDVEYILRYFAIKDITNTDDYNKNQIILKKFLNDNMAKNYAITTTECERLKEEFVTLIEKVYEQLGDAAFNNISYKVDENGENIYSDQLVKKFHPTIYESIMLSFEFAIRKNLSFNDLPEKQLRLLNDLEFREAITTRTTNIENIKKRVSIASRYLFGKEYDWS